MHRLGQNVSGWNLNKFTVDAGERRFGHAAHCDFESFEPGVALAIYRYSEAAQLCLATGLAGSKLHPAA